MSPENNLQRIQDYATSDALKVLIVDDSAADAMLFRQIIRDVGERDIAVAHCPDMTSDCRRCKTTFSISRLSTITSDRKTVST